MNESLEDISSGRIELPTRSYVDFLEEVFIKPIRTAVVVDDEFPTLDQFLSDPVAASEKPYASRAKDIIEFCRARKPYPWIVDIHDGQNIPLEKEGESATHFDHTDLLVLDYHLKGEQHGGDLAVGLLKRLASNDHFNLVIIYTNNDVSSTLREIGLSLCNKVRVKQFCSVEVSARAEGVYQDWIDQGDDIVVQLIDSLDSLAFIKAVYMDEIGFKGCLQLEEFYAFKAILESREVNYNRLDMLRLILRLEFEKYADSMSGFDYGNVQLNESPGVDSQVGVNWLRVDSLFLTIIKKSDVSPEHFSSRLVAAIAAWDPSPHRLIVTKMRSEISKRGVMVEKEVLQNPYLQAAWLGELFDVSTVQLRTNIRRNVVKHWDSLGGSVEPAVTAFAEELGGYLASNKIPFTRFHDVAYSKSELTALYVNHHVCSKAVEGHHLFTGHIFKVEDELWVCLTPACDLEPDRKVGKGVNKLLGNWKPFKAARIEPLDDLGAALANAHRGHHLFLSMDGTQPRAFCFAPEAEPTLKWQQFYAASQGVFDEGTNSFRLMIGRDAKGVLEFKEQKAEVVAQLRYEYALHLLHRLGSHLSRVGLDFVSYKK
jgi:hypothetical protein